MSKPNTLANKHMRNQHFQISVKLVYIVQLMHIYYFHVFIKVTARIAICGLGCYKEFVCGWEYHWRAKRCYQIYTSYHSITFVVEANKTQQSYVAGKQQVKQTVLRILRTENTLTYRRWLQLCTSTCGSIRAVLGHKRAPVNTAWLAEVDRARLGTISLQNGLKTPISKIL